MTRPVRRRLILGCVAIVIAAYCFSSYAMNASFSVAANQAQPFRDRAIAWGVAGLASLGLAIWLIAATLARGPAPPANAAPVSSDLPPSPES